MYKRYREYADALGLTDYAISKKVGVSRSCLSEWAKGKHKLSLMNRQKIALFLGTDNEFTSKIS